MRALVILNSHLPQKDRYLTNLQQADLILTADGGANRALDAGIEPDFVIGVVARITRERLAKRTQLG